MQLLKNALIGLGILSIPLLIIIGMDGTGNFVEPTKLQYDVITINADRLREIRTQTSFETIFLHADYDGDWPDPDDIHLLASAWRNQGGPDDFQTVPIEESVFEVTDRVTLENVIGSSSYLIPTTYLNYYLEPSLGLRTITLTPTHYSRNGTFVQYQVTATDGQNNTVTLDDNFISLNPSPPAKPGIR